MKKIDELDKMIVKVGGFLVSAIVVFLVFLLLGLGLAGFLWGTAFYLWLDAKPGKEISTIKSVIGIVKIKLYGVKK